MASKYPINVENPIEIVRLNEQDMFFTEAMGGLFPEEPDLSHVEKVIDMACGPGKWACDVAFHYPHLDVAGVDLSRTMIDYANATARSQRLKNVSFEQIDITKPLPFADGTFDLINARLLFSVLHRDAWSPFLAECARLLKPGGIVRLCELEWWTSNSESLQLLSGSYFEMLRKMGQSFSVDGRSSGIVHMLARLLQQTGFQRIGKRPFVIDSSAGEPLWYQSFKDLELAFSLLKPSLLKEGILSEETFHDLYHSTLIDLQLPEYTCTSFGLTVWGYRGAGRGAKKPGLEEA